MSEIKNGNGFIEIGTFDTEPVVVVAHVKPDVKIKKKKFPLGIFFMMLIIESIIACCISMAYFIYTGKTRIDDIEKYTIKYSITLAEAFTQVAEMSYRNKKFSRLRNLFREKIVTNTIDEAFFVLKNGKIVVHSDKNRKKSLKGNIANDEFAYNIDLILRPLYRKSREAQFTDYNILSKPVPFPRQYRILLKKYLYKKIDSSGWLVSRAVFIKKKPVGTVNFLISKERIFTVILSHVDDSIAFLIIALATAFFLSLSVSIVVLIRYRSIQSKSVDFAAGRESIPVKQEMLSSDERMVPREVHDFSSQAVPGDRDDGIITIELLSDVKGEDAADIGYAGDSLQVINGDSEIDTTRQIKDAIPIARKE